MHHDGRYTFRSHHCKGQNVSAVAIRNQYTEAMSLTERMIIARRRKGWTQADLSREAGVRQGTVSLIEREMQNGTRVMPAIAAALDVPLEWLVAGENPPDWYGRSQQMQQYLADHIQAAALAAARVTAPGASPPVAARDRAQAYLPDAAHARDDVADELRSLRAMLSAQTEVMTELLRKCRKIDDMAEQLDRLEDRGPGLGGAADEMPARKRGGA